MLVEFSAIIFSNKFSAPFSLFSTPETPVIWKLVCLMLSRRCLKLSSFFKFLLLCSDCVICLTVHCSVSVYQFIFCWLLLAYFYFTHCILLLCLIPFYIFQLFVKLLCSSFFCIFLNIFVIITLNPFLNCLFIHRLVLFLRFCLVPSFGTYSSVSSICLILCAYFCVLGMLVTFPDLVDVAL